MTNMNLTSLLLKVDQLLISLFILITFNLPISELSCQISLACAWSRVARTHTLGLNSFSYVRASTPHPFSPQGAFPARLKKVLIVGAPIWFRVPYSIISLLLKDKVRERVRQASLFLLELDNTFWSLLLNSCQLVFCLQRILWTCLSEWCPFLYYTHSFSTHQSATLWVHCPQTCG